MPHTLGRALVLIAAAAATAGAAAAPITLRTQAVSSFDASGSGESMSMRILSLAPGAGVTAMSQPVSFPSPYAPCVATWIPQPACSSSSSSSSSSSGTVLAVPTGPSLLLLDASSNAVVGNVSLSIGTTAAFLSPYAGQLFGVGLLDGGAFLTQFEASPGNGSVQAGPPLIALTNVNECAAAVATVPAANSTSSGGTAVLQYFVYYYDSLGFVVLTASQLAGEGDNTVNTVLTLPSASQTVYGLAAWPPANNSNVGPSAVVQTLVATVADGDGSGPIQLVTLDPASGNATVLGSSAGSYSNPGPGALVLAVDGSSGNMLAFTLAQQGSIDGGVSSGSGAQAQDVLLMWNVTLPAAAVQPQQPVQAVATVLNDTGLAPFGLWGLTLVQ